MKKGILLFSLLVLIISCTSDEKNNTDISLRDYVTKNWFYIENMDGQFRERDAETGEYVSILKRDFIQFVLTPETSYKTINFSDSKNQTCGIDCFSNYYRWQNGILIKDDDNSIIWQSLINTDVSLEVTRLGDDVNLKTIVNGNVTDFFLEFVDEKKLQEAKEERGNISCSCSLF